MHIKNFLKVIGLGLYIFASPLSGASTQDITVLLDWFINPDHAPLIVNSPLNSLVVLADSEIKSVKDLKGKTVGFSVGGFEDAVLGAMLETHGLVLDDVRLVNVNFALSPSLYAGQVDAVIGAFRNFELNQMDIDGRPGRAFYPEDHGVPTYEELIFVAHPEYAKTVKVRRFLDV
ncbi:MAG: ABC transporter substrate-binding protein, partial [Flavobacteriaceae bacterium]